ncbi:MAG TPA: DUF2071 domain-containing protein [Gaiellaceae bacterium]
MTEFLAAAARQAAVTNDSAHRPWPMPEGPWANAQSWVDLAFLHWRVDADEIAKLIGPTVELDTFGGEAWLGITPFLLKDFRVRGTPPIPRLSTFAELNVRTYVTRDDKPGIWFFTLEAASTLAVEGAKRLYRLPYHRAQMSYRRAGDHVHYESARAGAAFSGNYRGEGDLFRAEPGSLEEFLTERYCLYTEDGGRGYRAEIHHPPWDLQQGAATIDLNTMAPVAFLDDEPHVLFSPRQDVVIWPLEEL